jgi:hypothetical protein
MTSVLYGIVTDPKYVDMAAREPSNAEPCVLCGSPGAVERAGMRWCAAHSVPEPVAGGSGGADRDAGARWQAWVAAAAMSSIGEPPRP